MTGYGSGNYGKNVYGKTPLTWHGRGIVGGGK